MASTDARPVPIKNTAFRAYFDLRLNTGALNPGAAGLDSEVSIDGGTIADCTNEATEIATSSGHYYLDLTAGEMNGDGIVVQVKSSTTNAVTRTITIYPQETGDIKVDVQSWNATAVATPDTAGYPKVTHKAGTGTGELSITSGVVSANVEQIHTDAAAAIRLALSAGQIIPGTVTNAGFSPTTTEFECSDITTATSAFYVGRAWLWTSGALAGQVALVQAYSLQTGRGHFTVTTMTGAPANAVTGILV